MKVLSTKSLDKTIIAHARSLNMEVKCVDFIEIKETEFDIASVMQGFDSVAFTSANAVNYFFQNKKASELLNGKNIFSLSGKTQEELLKHHTDISLAKENAGNLADAIVQSKHLKSVLHIAGNLTLDVFGKKLKNAGIDYTLLAVYQTVLKSERVLDKDIDTIMFYSPSGVESFFAANEINKQMVYCCIGNTTAAALKDKYSDAKIILPSQPTPRAMIDAIFQFAKPGAKL